MRPASSWMSVHENAILIKLQGASDMLQAQAGHVGVGETCRGGSPYANASAIGLVPDTPCAVTYNFPTPSLPRKSTRKACKGVLLEM